jgi:hypothetical protein
VLTVAALSLIRLIGLIGLIGLALPLILSALGAVAIGLVARVLPLASALLVLVTLVTLLLTTLTLILRLLIIHFDLQASRLTGVMARHLAWCKSNSASWISCEAWTTRRSSLLGVHHQSDRPAAHLHCGGANC